MAGTCLIPVDQDYVDGLINVASHCHAVNSEAYVNKKYTGLSCCDTCNATLEGLKCASDCIFYLQNLDLDIDQCQSVHIVKETLMTLCTFTEEDILGSLVANAILQENGNLTLLETGTEFIQKEN